MTFKRKRSASELCSSPSSSTISSPPNNGSMMDVCPGAFYNMPAPHLHSRTMKRFRDNRPSEDQIHRMCQSLQPDTASTAVGAALHHNAKRQRTRPTHIVTERTLNLLYSAAAQQQQHQSQHQSLTPCGQFDAFQQLQPAQAAPSSLSQSNKQHSLHRFWNINSAPSSAAGSPAVEHAGMLSRPSSCEDCGVGFGNAGHGDGMDLDNCVGDSEPSPCSACGKHVCYSCSVSNLGEDKKCLQCVGRKVWVGGIGWIHALPVC